MSWIIVPGITLHASDEDHTSQYTDHIVRNLHWSSGHLQQLQVSLPLAQWQPSMHLPHWSGQQEQQLFLQESHWQSWHLQESGWQLQEAP